MTISSSGCLAVIIGCSFLHQSRAADNSRERVECESGPFAFGRGKGRRLLDARSGGIARARESTG